MQKKRVPLRMCLGCGEMKPKSELIKIVKSPAKSDDDVCDISVDLGGKSPGRGAYICKNSSCLKLARKSRRIERTFSCKVSDEVFRNLEEEISKHE